jgi:hypothetical protein
MSFKESIIIPLSLWKQCKLPSNLSETTSDVSEGKKSPLGDPVEILKNPNLSSDVKVALYHQAKKHQKTSAKNISVNQWTTSGYPHPTTVFQKPSSMQLDHIINSLSEKERPFAVSILGIIHKYPDQVAWNNNGEIIIDGKTIPGTDIVKLFQYITKTLIITKQEDIPLSGEVFYKKLLEIGVPDSWVRIHLPKRASNRKKPAVKRITWKKPAGRKQTAGIQEEEESSSDFSEDDADYSEAATWAPLSVK